MGPFSGSDQVSAVVKLSLFGRKNSKHEPEKAAHPFRWCIEQLFATSASSPAQPPVVSLEFHSVFRDIDYSALGLQISHANS